MKKLYALTISILISVFSFAQNGFVSGKVVDQTTGEELIGVAILIKGATKGTSTDIDGTYKLELAPGTYDLQVSYISYQTKVITGVVVKPKEITSLNITLQSSEKELGEIVIEAKVDRETSAALVLEQKNSVVLFDGISADQIRKTPDRNTADVLKRVSGATIQDNSFVVVRGLPDRYNAAFLNGSPLPSSEPDRKAFAFDIFPSALLSDLKVIKTAMPSLSGEFAGGLILVRTKDIPEKNYYNLSLGASFDFITSFQDFKSSSGGSLDFLGFDDGSRTLPERFPTNQELVSTQNAFNKDQLVEYAKMLHKNYTIRNVTGAPGLNFQYSMGHNMNLIPKAKRESTTHKSELGSVFALTYNSNNRYREIERNDFGDEEQLINFIDNQYTINTSWGAIWNLAYMHSKSNGANTRISVKNLFNVNTFDQVVVRNGFDLALDYQVQAFNYFYSQNNLFSTQVNGEHVLPGSKIKFEWGGGYSRLNRIIPDYRNVEYRRVDSTQNFAIPFSTTVQQDKAGRFFSDQLDNIGSGNFDFTLPIKLGATRHELKIGTALQYRDRDFAGRQLGYVRYKVSGSQIPAISTMGVDSIFNDSNMGPEGLMIREVTRKSDTYESTQSIIAGYLQMESSFFENKLKFVYGVRFESFRQVLNTYSFATGDPVNIDTTVNDFLPSLNIIYGLNKNMNLRLSGSQTVTRAEARELAPFAFYDFSLFALVSGNPDLKRTRITNADLRYEWYPAGGQLVSFTGFFKWFENPIEKVMEASQSSGRKFSYRNVPTAYCWGLELEYRFTIASFMKETPSRFLQDLSFVGNLAYMNSEVNLDSVIGASARRPLQGQSPFIVNAGLHYNDSKYDFGVSFAVNYIGRRIFSVGNDVYPSIWENPRVVMDLQLTKTFLKKKLEIRINFRDLLAQDAIFYQDTNENGKYESSDNLMINQRVGQQASFTVGYKF